MSIWNKDEVKKGDCVVKRILMVCLGNICRSPAAEVILRDMGKAEGLELEVDSCGTSGWHLGQAPYGPMIKAAATRGYELRPLRARKLQPVDFNKFDLILASDTSVLADVAAKRPAGAQAELRLLLEPDLGSDVPDPYYTRDFDQALDLIEEGCRRVLKRL